MSFSSSLRMRTLRCVVQLRRGVKTMTGPAHAAKDSLAAGPSLAGLTGAGFVAGSIGSLVGLSGAFLALPIMTGPLGMTAHLASGSSIAAVLGTSTTGSLTYLLRDEQALERLRSATLEHLPAQVGDVHVLTAACLALSSMFTAFVGARVSKRLSARTMKMLVASFMLFTVPSVPLRDYVKKLTHIDALTSENDNDENASLGERALRPLTIGVFSGFTSGLLGIGGGMIIVPALCLFTNIDYQVALGTSLAAMIPSAAVGSLTHLRQGTMLPRAVLPLAVGSSVGAFIGGKLGKEMNETYLKNGFAVMMSVLGVRTMVQALRMVK